MFGKCVSGLLFVLVLVLVLGFLQAKRSGGYKISHSHHYNKGKTWIGGGIRKSSRWTADTGWWSHRSAQYFGTVYGLRVWRASSYYEKNPETEPAVCSGDRNGTDNTTWINFDFFICPGENDAVKDIYCCGEEGVQYCCDARKLTPFDIVMIVLNLFPVLTLCVVIYFKCKDNIVACGRRILQFCKRRTESREAIQLAETNFEANPLANPDTEFEISPGGALPVENSPYELNHRSIQNTPNNNDLSAPPPSYWAIEELSVPVTDFKTQTE